MVPLFPPEASSTLVRLTLIVVVGLGLVAAGCGATEAGIAVIVPTSGETQSTSLAATATSTTTTSPAQATLPTTSSAETPDAGADTSTVSSGDEASSPTTTPAAVTPNPTRPAWLGTRVLPTTPDGVVVPQTTPIELTVRQFPTIDILPAPTGGVFESSIEPLAGEALQRSTWNEDCPVGTEDLRYVRLTFWGFDDRPHQGELIVNQAVVDDVIEVFRGLFAVRFPIEEMRIATSADVDAPPTGDGNNTTSFVCRAVVGGSRFSEHAYGLAIDINPFQNPYRKDAIVLPELAPSYLERTNLRPGMFVEGGPVVSAFDKIGWGWGGRWQSLDDYHHFALNNR